MRAITDRDLAHNFTFVCFLRTTTNLHWRHTCSLERFFASWSTNSSFVFFFHWIFTLVTPCSHLLLHFHRMWLNGRIMRKRPENSPTYLMVLLQYLGFKGFHYGLSVMLFSVFFSENFTETDSQSFSPWLTWCWVEQYGESSCLKLFSKVVVCSLYLPSLKYDDNIPFPKCCWSLFFAYAAHRQQIKIRGKPKFFTKVHNGCLKNEIHQAILNQVNKFIQGKSFLDICKVVKSYAPEKVEIFHDPSWFQRRQIFTQCCSKYMNVFNKLISEQFNPYVKKTSKNHRSC